MSEDYLATINHDFTSKQVSMITHDLAAIKFQCFRDIRNTLQFIGNGTNDPDSLAEELAKRIRDHAQGKPFQLSLCYAWGQPLHRYANEAGQLQKTEVVE